MINKIAHLSDVHIYKSQDRHDEYRKVFNTTYNSLNKNKPDLIVLVGDTYNDYIELSNEAEILMASFLNNLARISPVVIVYGNHEIRKKQLSRLNTVESLVNLINNPKITYYGKSDFYEYDDNITFVNWAHRDRNIKNPWLDIQHTRKKNRIYIDLFHDPISGGLSHDGKPLNEKSKKHENIDSFKGDFVFLGDLHFYQTFRKDKTAAYSGSLIQQNFGELPTNHGYIMWDIKTKTHEFININNETVFINFEVPELFNYDNITLNSPHIHQNSNVNIKIKWCDLVSNVDNKSNEMKLRNYIKSKFGVKNVKIERSPIYTDITEVKFINEGINIEDADTQRVIFNEYLRLNKYSDEFISKVLEIDDIINSKLDHKAPAIFNNVWGVEKYWFNNFQSYGDNNIIDWQDINGIVQIHGENQEGKTTIIDALTFILYGVTMSTTLTEKNGNNRYINNKRDLDECNGGAIININDEKYLITRKCVRTWNRDKSEISKVQMFLDYYRGTEMIEDNKLNGEKNSDTLAIITDILGDFKSFIRTILTNADNINEILSLDRATFIDSLLRNSGLDIFEQKLKTYKDYLKDLNETKIELNPLDEEDKIININKEKIELETKIKDIIIELEENKETINILRNSKDDELKKLHKINIDLLNYDLSILENNIRNNKTKIVNNNLNLIEYRAKVSNKIEFDYESYRDKKTKYDLDFTTYNDLKVKTTELYSNINTLKVSINQTTEKINNIINSKIIDIKSEINTITNKTENDKKNVVQLIKDHLLGLKDIVQENKNTIDTIKTKQETIKSNVSLYKEQIYNIENSDVCTMCGKALVDDSLEHVQKQIEELKNKIKILHDDYVSLDAEKVPYQTKIDEILIITENIKNKNFDDDLILKAKYDETISSINADKEKISKLESDLELLKNSDYDSFLDISETIKNIIDKKLLDESELLKTETNFKINKEQYDILNNSIILDKKLISDLYLEKVAFEEIKNCESLIEKLVLENDNLDLKVKNDELIIEKINSQEEKVQDNLKIQTNIDKIETDIKTIENNNNILLQTKDKFTGDILLLNNDIKNINEKLEKYAEQEKINEIRKVYMKAIHRDGLPTYLLKKSIVIINQELSNLLSNVDFTLFFDSELNLKLSSDTRLDVTQNAIQSSGKEKTFSALALKMALRKVNKKNMPDFILLDEIFGKLINKSVEQLIEFISDRSKELNKIVIIEHTHPINYDALINVTKNEDGVSSLELIY